VTAGRIYSKETSAINKKFEIKVYPVVNDKA
jgi:hypothetical protein